MISAIGELHDWHSCLSSCMLIPSSHFIILLISPALVCGKRYMVDALGVLPR